MLILFLNKINNNIVIEIKQNLINNLIFKFIKAKKFNLLVFKVVINNFIRRINNEPFLTFVRNGEL